VRPGALLQQPEFSQDLVRVLAQSGSVAADTGGSGRKMNRGLDSEIGPDVRMVALLEESNGCEVRIGL